jgi:DNA-binding response OmpR family regulator
MGVTHPLPRYRPFEPIESILIVDGDAGARGRLAELVGSAGYKAREASCGVEALAAARHAPPSAILLDVALPGMTGYDVCRTLREQFGEELPIIFVSSDRTEPLDRVAGLMIGADDYVTAPFAPAELVARIKRSLTRVHSLRRARRARV